jgi:hypothetical protein
MLLVTKMTDAVNNVANALRETGSTHVDTNLYHPVMDLPSFTKEAMIVAFSHLLDNCWYILTHLDKSVSARMKVPSLVLAN